MGFQHQWKKTTSQIHPDRQHSCGGITWSRNVQRLPKDVNTGTRRLKTLTQVVDELLRQAFNESSNEMVCMSIEDAARRHHDGQFVSMGARSSHSCRRQQNQLNHQETRCTELCDYASRRLFVTRASRAAQEKQLGEQKTFHKASRRGHSRAATGRGAGRAQCGDSTSTGGAERLQQQQLHQTCRRFNHLEHVCVEKCPLTTRHTAARSGDSCGGTSADHTHSHRALAGSRPGGRTR